MAQVLVHPSREEGFGFTPVEALALGTPAMAAREGAGALPADIVGCVMLVNADDVVAWRRGMLALALFEGAQERARQFTWARTAAATVEVYRRVVS